MYPKPKDMKKLLIIIALVLSFTASAQDIEILGFINQYRMSHGKKTLVISEKLTEIATICNQNNVNKDTLIHTNLRKSLSTGEICTMVKSLPFTKECKENFIKFIKTNFNIIYTEPITNIDIIRYAKLLSMYSFDQSPPHKRVLLSNVTNVGFSAICQNIEKGVAVTKTIAGKTYTFKKIIESYKFDCFVTIDFN